MKVPRSLKRLYRIELKVASPVCLLAQVGVSSAWLWHARLGRLNFDSIQKLSKREMAQGVPKITHPSQVCDCCMAGKQSRVPFPKETRFRAEKPLDLVYADVCGPIRPETKGGNKYLLMTVDDHSMYMWVFFILIKAEVFDRFKEFKEDVELEHGRKIKALRTYNGVEFTSKDFKLLCSKTGMYHQLTSPYSPQQNEVVERRNRTKQAIVALSSCEAEFMAAVTPPPLVT
ncbi:hypothetical protein E3N88_12898 [Mikania micrantha]|uniref:Integrase catalytic domain-containing protein n=1 Tax=Mikania micrantha TaxID=192012 RepID=A0A5N6P845_9ASTR|nr:hypothetical protein E3N88_12898 [Mikania micrantha]